MPERGRDGQVLGTDRRRCAAVLTWDATARRFIAVRTLRDRGVLGRQSQYDDPEVYIDVEE